MDINDPKVQRSLGVYLLVVIIVYVYFFTGLFSFTAKNYRIKMGRLLKEKEKLEKTIAEAKRVAVQMDELIAKYNKLSNEYHKTKAMLPHEADVDGLLRTFTALAVRSRVVVSKFESLPTKPYSVYSEIPFTMKVKAKTFSDLMDFMVKIGNMPRIVNIKNVMLNKINTERAGFGVSQKKSAEIECSFTVSAYVMAKSEEIKDITEILPSEYLEKKFK